MKSKQCLWSNKKSINVISICIKHIQYIFYFKLNARTFKCFFLTSKVLAQCNPTPRQCDMVHEWEYSLTWAHECISTTSPIITTNLNPYFISTCTQNKKFLYIFETTLTTWSLNMCKPLFITQVAYNKSSITVYWQIQHN